MKVPLIQIVLLREGDNGVRECKEEAMSMHHAEFAGKGVGVGFFIGDDGCRVVIFMVVEAVSSGVFLK